MLIKANINDEYFVGDYDPRLPESFMETYAASCETPFVKDEEGNWVVHQNIGPENLRDLIMVLTPETRKTIMDAWILHQYPVHFNDELKHRSIVVYFKWTKSKFCFIDLDDKRYVTKRFISYWEMLRDISPKFIADGFFAKFESKFLTDWDLEKVKELIDEGKSVDELMQEISSLSPEELAKRYNILPESILTHQNSD